mgnify:CR=1 FL=1
MTVSVTLQDVKRVAELAHLELAIAHRHASAVDRLFFTGVPKNLFRFRVDRKEVLAEAELELALRRIRDAHAGLQHDP